MRKTPGREDADVVRKAAAADNDAASAAAIILQGLGGRSNVMSLDNCVTRLRLEIRDDTAVDEAKIKSAGIAGIIRPNRNTVQVIVGTEVQHVANEMKKML